MSAETAGRMQRAAGLAEQAARVATLANQVQRAALRVHVGLEGPLPKAVGEAVTPRPAPEGLHATVADYLRQAEDELRGAGELLERLADDYSLPPPGPPVPTSAGVMGGRQATR